MPHSHCASKRAHNLKSSHLKHIYDTNFVFPLCYRKILKLWSKFFFSKSIQACVQEKILKWNFLFMSKMSHRTVRFLIAPCNKASKTVRTLNLLIFWRFLKITPKFNGKLFFDAVFSYFYLFTMFKMVISVTLEI